MKAKFSARGVEQPIRFEVDGVGQIASGAWYRGEHCNFNPLARNLNGPDATLRHVVQGWAPPEPCIDQTSRIIAFGSCFAEHIADWLVRRDFNVGTAKDGENADTYVVRFSEGMVNTFALRQQIEWAWENKTPEGELWHGYDAQAHGYDEQVRLKTKAIFDEASIFILTVGLSEVWYDKVNNEVFWRAIPREKHDPERHSFRVSTVAENKANLHAIAELIGRRRPDAKIIFTLSPIPLVATFRPVSCITANAVSKAILRAALDEVMTEAAQPDRLFYWPSYELVTTLFGDPWELDRRHVKHEILEYVMALFGRVWCRDTTSEEDLAALWAAAVQAPSRPNKALVD